MAEKTPDNSSDDPADWGDDHPAFQLGNAELMKALGGESPEDIDEALAKALGEQSDLLTAHEQGGGADDGGKPDGGDKIPPEDTTAKAPEGDGGKKPEGGEEPPEGDDPAGVLTKDGKRVLPFDVLEDTRREVTALRQENERLRTAAGNTAPPAEDRMSDEDRAAKLAEIREQYGEGMVELLEDHRSETARLAQENENLRQQLSAQADRTVQDVVAERPALVALQAKGGDAWKEFVALNRSMMSTPGIATKPVEQRFDMAMKALGIEDPSQSVDKTPEGGKPDAAAAAKAAQAAKAAGDELPASLSDMSGGKPPEDLRTSLESASMIDLHSTMATMDTDQLMQFLEEQVV